MGRLTAAATMPNTVEMAPSTPPALATTAMRPWKMDTAREMAPTSPTPPMAAATAPTTVRMSLKCSATHRMT